MNIISSDNMQDIAISFITSMLIMNYSKNCYCSLTNIKLCNYIQNIRDNKIFEKIKLQYTN